MKILFVCRMFDNVAGGVERMASSMMNEMIRRGHDVELLTWDLEGAQSYYKIDPKVKWHKLDMGHAHHKASWLLRAKRQLAIRKLITATNPSVVMAFQHGPFFTVALSILGLGVPIIAAERNAPNRFEHTSAGRFKRLIYQSFRLADKITVQIEQYIPEYPSYLKRKLVCIPNPVFPAERMADPRGLNVERKLLICVGRLSYQKNQSALIRAFALVAERAPEWHLQFVGDGEDKDTLEALCRDLNLSDRVEFVGAVKNVDRYYNNAHLFCLPSRWEGFPNALAEAMVRGLPSAGFKECAGVCHLINEETGVLAQGNGDDVSLSKALLSLMSNDDLRVHLGQNSSHYMSNFLPKIVFDRLESELISVSKNK
ncbi:glycosyltransferase family 4 protein [Vibrio europaeus]|uniref:glycosyltransferase family 4 protein n=1 Tax=Vibrio europaeus TaxID=300876 RepID=UPI00234171B4|nr:glycosyltransferase family 4 protein [Vibrio europaeus]MDC5850449.1 glycosyltransferase family 4 protein [Vibrio europaeus]